MNADDILFQQLNIPVMQYHPLAGILQIVQEREDKGEETWFYDTYRDTRMLPIYTPGGSITKQGAQNTRSDPLEWTTYTPLGLSWYFNKYIFPLMDTPGRIILLATESGRELNPHIDCSREAWTDRQHKLRIVLQGRSDSLYFLDGEHKSFAPNIPNGTPFIIDGSYPHGMINEPKDDHDGIKYTLCMGAPWSGADTKPYLDMLEASEHLPGLQWRFMTLPDDYERYFEDPEERKLKFDT